MLQVVGIAEGHISVREKGRIPEGSEIIGEPFEVRLSTGKGMSRSYTPEKLPARKSNPRFPMRVREVSGSSSQTYH